ncbi:MAG: histidine kinase dimerization/phospho-acceptor domain-containing protein, partial [Cyanobacteria bacterium J06648_10]
IDDGVDAVAIHGFGGLWSTLSVALFGNLELVGTGLSRHQQLLVQLLGSGVALFWSFGLTYLVLRSINRLFPLRVSAEEEEMGLNVSEHNAKTEVYELFRVMDQQAKTQDFSLRVPEDPFTEAGKIAHHYNRVVASVETYANWLQEMNEGLEKTVDQRTEELLNSNAELSEANRKLERLDKLKDEFLANTSHELRTPLNGIIGLSEYLMEGATGQMSEQARVNLSMIASSGRRLYHLVNEILDYSNVLNDNFSLQL